MTNGDPLLLQQPFGRGRVLLWTTSLSGAWTSLPVRQAYLPFVYRLLNYASGFDQPPHNVNPGDPLIASVPASAGNLFVTTPDARLDEVQLQKRGERSFVRIEDTRKPGAYELRDRSGNLISRFSVATPLSESDLRTLTAPQQERLGEVLHARFSNELDALRTALWREGDGREHAGWVLLAILALVLADAAATRYFFS